MRLCRARMRLCRALTDRHARAPRSPAPSCTRTGHVFKLDTGGEGAGASATPAAAYVGPCCRGIFLCGGVRRHASLTPVPGRPPLPPGLVGVAPTKQTGPRPRQPSSACAVWFGTARSRISARSSNPWRLPRCTLTWRPRAGSRARRTSSSAPARMRTRPSSLTARYGVAVGRGWVPQRHVPDCPRGTAVSAWWSRVRRCRKWGRATWRCCTRRRRTWMRRCNGPSKRRLRMSARCVCVCGGGVRVPARAHPSRVGSV